MEESASSSAWTDWRAFVRHAPTLSKSSGERRIVRAAWSRITCDAVSPMDTRRSAQSADPVKRALRTHAAQATPGDVGHLPDVRGPGWPKVRAPKGREGASQERLTLA